MWSRPSKPWSVTILFGLAKQAFAESSRYAAFLALPAGAILSAIGGETLRNGFYMPDGSTVPYTGNVARLIGLSLGLGGLTALVGTAGAFLAKRPRHP